MGLMKALATKKIYRSLSAAEQRFVDHATEQNRGEFSLQEFTDDDFDDDFQLLDEDDDD